MTMVKNKTKSSGAPLHSLNEPPPAAPVEISNQTVELETLFMSIGEGAITTDELGRITRVNPMATRLLGYKKTELIGEWFPKKLFATDITGDPVNFIDRPIA